MLQKNNATVKLVVFSQQPSSQDLCVNIAHIRSKAVFKSFFQSSYYKNLSKKFQKHHATDFQCFSTECV